MEGIKNALVLAPHPDDGEFGCGSTLKKLTESGVKVTYAAFSPCNKSLPEGFTANGLFSELKNATRHLGIAEDSIITFEYPVREFPAHRQAILEDLIKLRKEIEPELVLLPNSDDVHQDHQVLNAEGIRAFKHSRLLGYELPWNSLQFTSNFHVEIDNNHIEAKTLAIAEYKSQGNRTYNSKEFFEGLARVRGVQIGVEYAEAFETIRWML